jgi:hypothetical protein
MWCAGISLESLILFRSFRSKMFGSYPLFYAYIVYVLSSEISRLVIYRYRPSLYAHWWWGTQFLSLLVGYFIIFDIFEKSLAAYEGVKRFARIVGIVVFGGVVALTTFQLVARNHFLQGLTSVEVERNLRGAEIILLGGILMLVAYYRIPIGRNLKGIIVGYGAYVATVVMSNAAWSYMGESSRAAISAVQSEIYLAALMVWTVTLWTYRENAVPSKPDELNEDYQMMVAKTKKALHDMRSHLGKGDRP